jgi:hypothetical protein
MDLAVIYYSRRFAQHLERQVQRYIGGLSGQKRLMGVITVPRPLAWAVESWPFRPKPQTYPQRTSGVAQGWYGSGLSPYNHMTFNAIIPDSGMSLELFLTQKNFMRLGPK